MNEHSTIFLVNSYFFHQHPHETGEMNQSTGDLERFLFIFVFKSGK